MNRKNFSSGLEHIASKPEKRNCFLGRVLSTGLLASTLAFSGFVGILGTGCVPFIEGVGQGMGQEVGRSIMSDDSSSSRNTQVQASSQIQGSAQSNTYNYQESYYDFPESPEFKRLESRIPPQQSIYLFLYNKFVDVDRNGSISSDEFFGINRIFDIGKDDIMFAYAYKAKIGANNLSYKLWDKAGKLLAETVDIDNSTFNGYKIRGLMRSFHDIEHATPPDAIDRLDEFGPGEYVLTATVNGEQLRRAEFTIIKNINGK